MKTKPQPIATFAGGTFSELIRAYSRQRMSRDRAYSEAVRVKTEQRLNRAGRRAA